MPGTERKRYTIGIDLGTSSVKAVLLDEQGRMAAKTRLPVELADSVLPDGAGYVGIDPEKLWQTVCGAISSLARKADGGKVEALSIVSASGNTLLCDEQGKPLINAFSWTNAPMKREFEQVFGDFDVKKIPQISGWPFFYTFPLAHLSFIKVHAPRLLKSAAKVCTATEYIICKLSGKWATDFSTATPFYLANQRGRKYHAPYLNALGLTEGQLPALLPSGTRIGEVADEAASSGGLFEDTAVVLGSFDHPGAAIGCGVAKEGKLLISCGTSWVCFFPCADRDMILSEGLLCDPFLSPYGPWGAMFSLPQVGRTIDSYIHKYIAQGRDCFKEFGEYAASSAGTGGLKISLDGVTEIDTDKFSKQNIAAAIAQAPALALSSRLDEFKRRGIFFKSAVMAGGPSEIPAFVEAMREATGLDVEVKYGAYSGAAGAAVMAFNAS
jgi:sugar (pentulose or hexulose) kinase